MCWLILVEKIFLFLFIIIFIIVLVFLLKQKQGQMSLVYFFIKTTDILLINTKNKNYTINDRYLNYSFAFYSLILQAASLRRTTW